MHALWSTSTFAARFAPLAILLLLPVASATAQPPAPEEGLLVTVPNPISSEALARIQSRIDPILNDANNPVKKIVFDFNPDGKAAATRDFGVCYSLADYIHHLSLNGLTTIAFVHAELTKHTVLPVLACSELVMSRDAALGRVIDEDDPQPAPEIIVAYRKHAREDRAALIVKMIDKHVEVFQGKDPENPAGPMLFRTAQEGGGRLLGARAEVPPGSVALYTAEKARAYGLCQQIIANSAELAQAYNIIPSSLRDDPLQGRESRPWMILVQGEITGGLRETMERRLRSIVSRKGNIVFLQLECDGGDPSEAKRLAETLKDLRDRDNLPVLTVAYIPERATATATIIALGCDEIVMFAGNAKAEMAPAMIGDFAALLDIEAGQQRVIREDPPNPQQLGVPDFTVNTTLLRQELAEFAEGQGYPRLLIEGMLDRELVILRARAKNDVTQRKLMSANQFAAANAEDEIWVNEGTIKEGGELLRLNAEQARDLGLARHLIDNRDIREVYTHYGLDPRGVREATPDWLDNIADFLRQPFIAILLVMVGIAALIIEFKIPGFSFAGILSALCFLLFFWSRYMSGELNTLAVLLFLMGVALIGVEIFVIPGFGLTGVSGIIFLVGGLGLASVDRIPKSSGEWVTLGTTMMQYGLSMLGAVVLALIVGRYLPNIPYANRLLLVPPTDKDELEETPLLPGSERAVALLGAIGTTATMLRPSGMARFGDEYVDVVSEGGFIPVGTRIQVVEVEGNRIVVKEV